jgi:Fe-S cluster assembly ATPase SufC
MQKGKIVHTGGAKLARQLEQYGYSDITKLQNL